MDPVVTDPVDGGRDPFVPTPASTAAQAQVEAFCAAHGLRDYAETAVRLAKDAFPGARGIALRVEGDTEPDARCLVIDVATGVGVDESLRRREQFVRRWVAAAPPQVAERVSLILDLS